MADIQELSVEESENIPIISVVGRSGTGKTTVLELLIGELVRRGYRVGTVKHCSHGFDADQQGKDSWRHAQAGSEVAAISCPHKMALFRNMESEMPLDDIVSLMGKVDVVLTEGYKRGEKPMIEVSRQAVGTDLLCPPEGLVCVMADYDVDTSVPLFALDDAKSVISLLEERFLRG
ncbi:MAG: molybdopterin-guanine dinucleotide biosynthesis protein B [Candidatus Undinarchaeales archaeon]|jgi:molybdopterin-guanine dinucleotide biosynthesis protein B|nr:molybdopterin-guanine dinucleotide biosynthesis protein B [Candidatus Undinarchaeales archaeon]MDP7491872.1 molybdopterin-guanine dinucleotide biosynthesis protein B [Candidatus Undinarchaeales archaeon]